jgi:phage-related protein
MVEQNINIAFSTTGTDTSQANIDKITNSLKGLGTGQVSAIKTTMRWNDATQKVEKVNVAVTKGLKHFKFEMLGVMFFGMAIQRTFAGLLQPAFELAGIFDIMSTTLAVFFLPAALMVLDPLLSMMDFFLGLPEPVQQGIGVLALFGVAIGGILAVLGTISLGLQSMGMAFGPLVGALGTAGGATGIFSGIISTLSGALSFIASLITGPVIAAIILFAGAWYYNSEGISAALSGLWTAFTNIFGNLIGIIEGFVGILTSLFEGDANRAFESLKYIGKNAVEMLINAFINLPIAILGVLYQVEYGIGKFVVTIIGTLYNFGGKIIEALARGIIGSYGFVKEAIRGIPYIGQYLGGGIDIAEGIGGAILGGAGALLGGIRGLIPFQSGGIVTRPTMGLLGEKGPEAVIPLNNQSSIATIIPTYNITANIKSDTDLRELAYKLNDMLAEDYRGRIGFR